MFCVFKKHQNTELSRVTRVTVAGLGPDKLSQTEGDRAARGSWKLLPARRESEPGSLHTQQSWGQREGVLGLSTRITRLCPHAAGGSRGSVVCARYHRLLKNPSSQLFCVFKENRLCFLSCFMFQSKEKQKTTANCSNKPPSAGSPLPGSLPRTWTDRSWPRAQSSGHSLFLKVLYCSFFPVAEHDIRDIG